MSMRSSNGPDILETYRWICIGEHLHSRVGSLKNPQGHGGVAFLPCYFMCRQAQQSSLSAFAKYVRGTHNTASFSSRAVPEAIGKSDRRDNLHNYVLGDEPRCPSSSVHSQHH